MDSTASTTPIHDELHPDGVVHPLPPEAPIYDRFRSMGMHAFERELISYATLQTILNVAHIVEADVTQRNVAAVAINREPDGSLHRG